MRKEKIINLRVMDESQNVTIYHNIKCLWSTNNHKYLYYEDIIGLHYIDFSTIKCWDIQIVELVLPEIKL